LSFQQSFKWNKYNKVQYFDLSFCSWNFCLQNAEAVVIKQGVIRNEMKTALTTDDDQFNRENQSAGEKLQLFSVRFVCNILVLGVLGGFFYGLYILFQRTPVMLSDLKCPSSDAEDTSDTGELVLCFLVEYMASITITLANTILPAVFNAIIKYEKYTPKTHLLVNLGRNISIRIASLVLTIASQYQIANCDYSCLGPESDRLVACSDPNLGAACSNSQLTESSCRRGICWENYVGQQFFKLTLIDFIAQVSLMIVDIFRSRFQEISFDVTKHVLDIVYSQTICWMGLFFAPLLSLVTFIKFSAVFIIKIVYIKSLCTPEKSFYQASRISSIFKYFLLLGFVVSVIPLGLFITKVTPSNACGPFNSQPDYYNVVISLIEKWNWTTGKNIIYFVGQMTSLYIMLAVLLLLIYYYWAQATAQADLCNRIEDKLSSISQQKKILIGELSKKEN